jgi:hypothetical protein
MADPMVTGPVHVWPVVPNQYAQALATTAAGLSGLAGSIPGGGAGSIIAAGASGVAAALANLGKIPVYLGTTMRGVRIRVRRGYSRVWNDLTGPEIAFDKIWAGREAMIFLDLTRYSDTVYHVLAGTPRPGGPPDAETPGARGTLMMTEGAAFPVVLRFPAYDYHPRFRANGGVAAYRFLACSPEGEDDWETGSGANVRHLMLHSQEVYDPRTNNLQLKDFNHMGLPPTAPN